ncbi:phage tail protein [Achromobacter sp. UMC71]|uniref:phage tail protein n=1 Tax=Achromobacter sp. UMC71 TaxID=1862320 RepID=UPI0016005062|nr:phage tail protein [Achromobacter sp. UMC71]MBB1625178.1 hypothetical protein [Achromobacter sp. UMC71]
MRKATELREFLFTANDFLRAEPDRLHVFIDKGRIVASGTPGLSHEYRFTLTMIVTDYAGQADAILLPLLAWLRVNQPELFENTQRREEAIVFEVDLNNNETVDIEINVQLTERVIVHEVPGQRLTVEHLKEPPHNFLPAEGPRLPVYLEDQQIATLAYPVGNA